MRCVLRLAWKLFGDYNKFIESQGKNEEQSNVKADIKVINSDSLKLFQFSDG